MISESPSIKKKLEILVIEDEPQIQRIIELELKYAGHNSHLSNDGNNILEKIEILKPDLILLDCMLPGKSGEEIINDIKIAKLPIPIIVLTAKDDISNKIKCLDNGADDYITKPFIADELLARIRAVYRRFAENHNSSSTNITTKNTQIPNNSNNILNYDDLYLDQVNRTVSYKSRDLDLRTKEFSLLRIFMMHPEQYLSRNFLFCRVWGYDFIGESNVIEVYIRYLRSRLEEQKYGKLIHTKRKQGYMLKRIPAEDLE